MGSPQPRANATAMLPAPMNPICMVVSMKELSPALVAGVVTAVTTG